MQDPESKIWNNSSNASHKDNFPNAIIKSNTNFVTYQLMHCQTFFLNKCLFRFYK